ncbi:MAG: hypothetical protein HY743_10865 [Deltaproteobacteria bacterium]|nr:hypothetical protein [Deltaproteobacteria bacterium]
MTELGSGVPGAYVLSVDPAAWADGFYQLFAGYDDGSNILVGNSQVYIAGGKEVENYLEDSVTAVKAKTDNLPVDPADQSQVEAAIAAAMAPLALEANVQTHAAAALSAYDPPTKAEMDAALAALRAGSLVAGPLQPLKVALEGSSGAKLVVKQGEAKPFPMQVVDLAGDPVDLSGCTVFLGVKQRKGDAEYTFSKADSDFDKSQVTQGIISVFLTATDTNQVHGPYVGELKVTFPGAPPATVEKSGDLTLVIEQAVTA